MVGATPLNRRHFISVSLLQEARVRKSSRRNLSVASSNSRGLDGRLADPQRSTTSSFAFFPFFFYFLSTVSFLLPLSFSLCWPFPPLCSKIPRKQARLTRPILRCSLKVTQLALNSYAAEFHRPPGPANEREEKERWIEKDRGNRCGEDRYG